MEFSAFSAAISLHQASDLGRKVGVKATLTVVGRQCRPAIDRKGHRDDHQAGRTSTDIRRDARSIIVKKFLTPSSVVAMAAHPASPRCRAKRDRLRRITWTSGIAWTTRFAGKEGICVAFPYILKPSSLMGHVDIVKKSGALKLTAAG
ncbi:hypothetical protein MTO96_014592 [Rhipicephalus appendiculatus]